MNIIKFCLTSTYNCEYLCKDELLIMITGILSWRATAYNLQFKKFIVIYYDKINSTWHSIQYDPIEKRQLSCLSKTVIIQYVVYKTVEKLEAKHISKSINGNLFLRWWEEKVKIPSSRMLQNNTFRNNFTPIYFL